MNDPLIPDSLPFDPQGYSWRLALHVNFGRGGGAAVYHIHDAQGHRLPIQYQYDKRALGTEGLKRTGFFLAGLDRQFDSWEEVVTFWPEYLAIRKSESLGDRK